LEERGVKYAIRLPANENLERHIEKLLTRPAGRPSQKPLVRYKVFLYRVASWTRARRVVAKVEFHAAELFPRVGFIVTNLELPSRGNEVRLWLSVVAYNLGNLWRGLALPRRIQNWSLTSLQQRFVKTGARLVKHARYYWLLLAEGHLSRRLFASMLIRIAALPLPDG
jgi:hypothetical protein